ncbi:isoprenylcysteine carboxyl methyltransferase family protein [Chitinophaga sp. S165]|uniref:isoprenylcysteine carboxyl methyltransferase family protein n=1 Tax=Chitinophaga sp. S165 TaxID=2135462 RepID=UPI000D70FA7E|nr:isoprenylcysteine carboxylmethyltransferase family protein [Chitinophaga sp. S165]PWV45883.1 isoprenylcysteine carboxyl methyltransferase (ICMT) family protein YpbQ [Chitinophaga sp. S165]
MNTIILTVFFLTVLLRLVSMVISGINERKLKKMGAVEYGKRNSMFLIVAHILFYLSCITEGALKGAFFYDNISYAGLAIFVASVAVLYYVIYSIRHIWTLKLILAPPGYHTINKSALFRIVRHPNYYLSVIPELVGFAIFFHAWGTLLIGMAIYLIPLVNRIREEEKVMKLEFNDY